MKINISQFGLKDSFVKNFWGSIMDGITAFGLGTQQFTVSPLMHRVISPRRNLQLIASSSSLSLMQWEPWGRLPNALMPVLQFLDEDVDLDASLSSWISHGASPKI